MLTDTRIELIIVSVSLCFNVYLYNNIVLDLKYLSLGHQISWASSISNLCLNYLKLIYNILIIYTMNVLYSNILNGKNEKPSSLFHGIVKSTTPTLSTNKFYIMMSYNSKFLTPLLCMYASRFLLVYFRRSVP